MSLYIKIAYAAFLIFILLAFGGTEPWSFTIFQAAVFILLGVQIYRNSLKITPLLKVISFFFIFLILYTLLQACFSTTVLEKTPLYPATLIRLYTLEHASIFFTWFATLILASQSAADFKQTRQFVWVISILGIICAASAFIAPGEYIRLFLDIKGGFGPFVNRNHGGLFLSLAAFAQLGLAASHITNYSKYVYDGKKGEFYIKQIIMTILFITLCAAVVFSRSRGAMLALGSGLFLYCVILSFILPQTIRKRILFLVLTLGIFLGGVFIVSNNVKDINIFAQRRKNISVDIRKMLYSSGFEIIKQRPLFGTGIGALPVIIPQYTPKKLNQYIERLHSDPFELLIGAGIIGALPLGAMFIWSVLIAIRRIKQLPKHKQLLYSALLCGAAAMLVSSMFDFPFYIPACSAVFFTITGLLAGVTFYREDYSRIKISNWLIVLFIVISMGSVYITLQKTLAWRAILFGRGLLYEGQITYYKKAINHYPSPRYAIYLAVSYYKQSRNKDLTEAERNQFRILANKTAEEYLKKYPRDKELSSIYTRSSQ